MNLSLLFPLGLTALAALIVPLLIHIVRRVDERMVDFAALRWLQSRVRPKRKRRFDEWLLLLLRLLLLVLLAAWLARPLLHGMPPGKRWVLVHPALPATARPQADAGSELHWLAPGFPRINDGVPTPAAVQPVSSLLREADSVIPPGTPVEVIVPDPLNGVDAERPRLSRELHWRIVPTATAAALPDPSFPPPPPLLLHTAPGREREARWFNALDAAWKVRAGDAQRPPVQPIGQQAPATQQAVLIWLDAASLPQEIEAWIRAGGTLIAAAETRHPGLTPINAATVMQDEAGSPVLRAWSLGRGHVLQFAGALDAEHLPALAQPDFPARLYAALTTLQEPIPRRAPASSQRPLTGASAWPAAPKPLQPSIAWIALAVFAIERLLANAPRREVGR